MQVTKLILIIGYEEASKIALRAFKEDKTLIQIIKELFDKDKTNELIGLLKSD